MTADRRPLVQEFRYHNGYYDSEEEQFRGFSRSEQRDIGDANSPDLVTCYTFDVGKTHLALKGKKIIEEVGIGPNTSTWSHYDGVDNDMDGNVDESDEIEPKDLF